jgi:uncharacterized protein (TIGR02466 family)|tara:strand:+ start:4123 stop:4863 length:741 start_codon:yes stop_codon:yes gene_type:complete
MTDIEVFTPFGPPIIKTKIPKPVMDALNYAFENHATAADRNDRLAGNQKREFALSAKGLKTSQDDFVNMLSTGSATLYKTVMQSQWNTMDYLTDEHLRLIGPQLELMDLNCTLHDAWGNISVAGDWNPIHKHSGAVSGVGYVRLPDNIEREWAMEDHDPSAGMITFVDGRAQSYSPNCIRFKPAVGDIYFFPAWLLHQVNPFRSKGERWSFSFNTTIENRNPCLELSDQDKIVMQREKERKYGTEV